MVAVEGQALTDGAEERIKDGSSLAAFEHVVNGIGDIGGR